MKRNHCDRSPQTCSAASTVATPACASSSASISSIVSGSRVDTVLRMDRRWSKGERGELDRSKLLNELELMPAPEKRRIDAATGV